MCLVGNSFITNKQGNLSDRLWSNVASCLGWAFLAQVLVVMSMGIGKTYNEKRKRSILFFNEQTNNSRAIEKDVLVVDKHVPLEEEVEETQ